MRAKSIKNKAKINVEMSPAELKAMLKKTTAELAAAREYAAQLEEEVKVWRSGGSVQQEKWTPSINNLVSRGPLAAVRATDASPSPSSSRPDTPSAYGALDKDEKEEFLRRENELSDQLAEKESALVASEKMLAELRDEISYLKVQEDSFSKENRSIASELSDLRISNARLESEAKDTSITLDTYKDKANELQRDIEDLKSEIEDQKKERTREKEEEKLKRKQDMLNEMMAKVDLGNSNIDGPGEKIRNLSGKLDNNDRDALHSHLGEIEYSIRDIQERLRQAQDDAELQSKRRHDVDKLLEKRDEAYEQLLAKTAGSVDVDDIRVGLGGIFYLPQSELESKFAGQEEHLRGEISVLTERMEKAAAEIRRLHSHVESYKLSNDELNRALTTTAAGNEDGETFANATRELERNRKQYEIQFAEFEIVKKSLMKDLQNRCEKVSVGGGVSDSRLSSSRCSSTRFASSTRLSRALPTRVHSSASSSSSSTTWMP